MRNSEYWKGRAELKIVEAEKLCLRHEQKMKGYFRLAGKDIEDGINRLYSKYAEDNLMSYAEALKYLTNEEREEFKRDLEFYIGRAKNPYFREGFREYLQALSTRARVKRLEELKAHIHYAAENAYAQTANDAETLFDNVYDDCYYRTAFDAFKTKNIGSTVKPYADRVLNSLLEYPWSGAKFSEKIWGNAAVFEKQADEILTRGMIQGKSNQKIAREIADLTGKSYKNAIRLARTETNFIANQATNDMYEELGVDEYEFLAILDEKTSSVCWELDGQHFPIKGAVPGKNYPPMHPNCRSTTVPYFEDEDEDERTAFVGKDAYKIPKDMTYKQWRREHIDGASKSGKGLASGKKGDTDGYSTIEKVFEVPYNDSKAVESTFSDFGKQYVDDVVENAIVVSKDNKAYLIKGTSGNVNIGLAGDDALIGAKVIHNHPDTDDMFGDCFSREDFIFFFEKNIGELQVTSHLGRYSMVYNGDKSISTIEAYELYNRAYKEALQEAFENMEPFDYGQLSTMEWISKNIEGFELIKEE